MIPLPHQAAALPWMLEGHRGLWWEPGVGKTLPLALAGEALGQRQLWLTTLQLLRDQTARDAAEIRSDSPLVQVLTSSNDRVDPQADVVVACYDTARNPKVWKQLFGLRWGSLALDEAHALANTASKRTTCIYGARQDSKGALFRRADFVWAATGTPVLNNPMDLWPHASRLWPKVAADCPTKDAWMGKYCQTRQGDYGVQVVGGRNLDELRQLMAPHVSIKTLEQVQPNLPPLVVDEIDIPIDADQRAEVLAAATPEQFQQIAILLAELDGGDAAAEVQLQGMMLQMPTLRRVLALVKARSVGDLVKGELAGGADRVIVFGNHIDALAAVAERVGKTARIINGTTGHDYRTAALRDFAAGRAQVLVCNATVAGTGLNLQACRRIIFLEAAWTPGPNRQAIGRCYRTGQRRPVRASYTSARGTIDQAVAGVLVRKSKMINQLMESADV